MFMPFCSSLVLPKGDEPQVEHQHAEYDSTDEVRTPLGLIAQVEGGLRHRVECCVLPRGVGDWD